ncbi:MAG: S8 family serine peptidase [Pseudomonadales bacterium]|nr:S8 family serine peptidase [Pseudomonadales bacterium]MCP5343806.1 S8 family serine peptidase [Pseudomonadales bacterium]
MAPNWLATNEAPGTIVNWSFWYKSPSGQPACTPNIIPSVESAIKNAHDAGILIVVIAGNDTCSADDYTPSRIPEAFTVGATTNGSSSTDIRSFFTRTGYSISTFAPGENVPVIDKNGNQSVASGTSIAAPLIAGVMAVACEASGTACNSGDTASLYNAFRATGTMGTVTELFGGGPVSGSTSRFIWQQW